MNNRLENIKDDKLTKKKCELRRDKVPEVVLWNISLEDRVNEHIKECTELLHHIDDRLKYHKTLSDSRVFLNEIMEIQNQVCLSTDICLQLKCTFSSFFTIGRQIKEIIRLLKTLKWIPINGSNYRKPYIELLIQILNYLKMKNQSKVVIFSIFSI